MSWQHTIIPALPFSRRGFLDAPTPYLIGLLLNPDVESSLKESPTKRNNRRRFSNGFMRSFSYNSHETKKCTNQDYDRISLPSNDSFRQRPLSGPERSLPPDCTIETLQEIKFWRIFLKGKCELEPDSLVIQLGKSTDIDNSNMPPDCGFENVVDFAEILKKPSDGVSIELPQPVFDMIRLRFALFEKSLAGIPNVDSKEVTRGKFVILCETFLHMYNEMFGSLDQYLNTNAIWTIADNGSTDVNGEDYLELYFNVS